MHAPGRSSGSTWAGRRGGDAACTMPGAYVPGCQSVLSGAPSPPMQQPPLPAVAQAEAAVHGRARRISAACSTLCTSFRASDAEEQVRQRTRRGAHPSALLQGVWGRCLGATCWCWLVVICVRAWLFVSCCPCCGLLSCLASAPPGVCNALNSLTHSLLTVLSTHSPLPALSMHEFHARSSSMHELHARSSSMHELHAWSSSMHELHARSSLLCEPPGGLSSPASVQLLTALAYAGLEPEISRPWPGGPALPAHDPGVKQRLHKSPAEVAHGRGKGTAAHKAGRVRTHQGSSTKPEVWACRLRLLKTNLWTVWSVGSV